VEGKGFLQCGAGFNVPLQPSTNPCAFTGSDNVHSFPYSTPVADFSQAEMVWEGTQPMGNYLHMGYNVAGTSDWKTADGASPLTLRANATEVRHAYGDDANVTEVKVRVFPSTTNPQLVTVITNQDFQVYVTHFYNFQPREGWTFVADGECLRPEQCA
jgi:hypothetical protein